MWHIFKNDMTQGYGGWTEGDDNDKDTRKDKDKDKDKMTKRPNMSHIFWKWYDSNMSNMSICNLGKEKSADV